MALRNIIPVAAFVLLAGAGAHAETVKFTFATTNGVRDFSSQAAVRWQKAMREASRGALDMTFIPGGALGGDNQLLQQLSNNEIQIHVAGPVVVHNLVKQYQCMEAEFVYNDEAHGLRVWNGPLGKEVSYALEKDYNITLLAVGARGARHLTANKPIEKPEDLKGVKVRVTNKLREDIFKAYGALPGVLPVSELYGGLQQGVFDAQENPISTIWGNKFYEVQKFISLTGHVQSYFVFAGNKKFVDSLKPEHRNIFDATLADAVTWMNKAVAEEEDDLLRKIEKTGRSRVVKPDVAAFQKIAEPIVRQYAAERCKPGLLDEIAKHAN
ncbi:MAG TPA: TRAP transporter substrate-binding protein [Alphaproteobacteria bacterium]|nr:TRAP transporter substrate-binding protein [Alphaproteobacteria bacterium]